MTAAAFSALGEWQRAPLLDSHFSHGYNGTAQYKDVFGKERKHAA